MTRIVSFFFAAVAFLMVVSWVVPGASPPAMIAVAPQATAPSATMVLLPPPGAPVPAPAVAPAGATVAQVAPVPARPAVLQVSARASGGCTSDPIACMLDGKSVSDDASDVTGTIVKPARRPAPLVHTVKAVR